MFEGESHGHCVVNGGAREVRRARPGLPQQHGHMEGRCENCILQQGPAERLNKRQLQRAENRTHLIFWMRSLCRLRSVSISCLKGSRLGVRSAPLSAFQFIFDCRLVPRPRDCRTVVVSTQPFGFGRGVSLLCLAPGDAQLFGCDRALWLHVDVSTDVQSCTPRNHGWVAAAPRSPRGFYAPGVRACPQRPVNIVLE